MSKRAIGIAVIVLVTLLSGAAIGKGGGHGGGHGGHGGGHGHGHGHGFGRVHVGGGHHGGGRFAVSRSFSRGSYRGNRAFAGRGGPNFSQIRNASVASGNARNAMNSLSHGGARNGRLLSNPAARGQLAAGLAMAGWHNRNVGSGWWQHGNGGYGWVGPLFWPFAYHDIYDHAIWGDGVGFWDYGYPDIYAGIFAPYGYDDLSGYMAPRPSGRRQSRVAPLAQMCGDDSRNIAGLPIDQIQLAVQPTEAQFAALDDLGNASISAAQNIRAACPAQIVLTAPGRLAVMQQRIEAMISAVATVQPPLEKFYGLLNDEQKARFNALADDQRKTNDTRTPLTPGCSTTQPAVMGWPASEIEARLHPNESQRTSLAALQDASTKAAEALKAACQPGEALTPPARLTTIGKRLDAMLQAVKLVRTRLEDFYATLSDEQKAQFEAIGPRRSA